VPDVKATLPATDFHSEARTYIFDIGRNKYRLPAAIDFEE
jgi:mRNA-degrading endonuclease HigB of HigAB toxin-antitoxin module